MAQSDTHQDTHDANRKRAVGQHRKRFGQQAMFWGVVIALAASSYQLLDYLMHEAATECASAGNICLAWPDAVLLAMLGVATITVIAHWWYLHEKKGEWNTVLESAQKLYPGETMDGYTELFRLYVQTKRRSYQLITFSILLLTYAVVAGLVGLQMPHTIHLYAEGGIFAAIVLLALVILQLAYLIGSTFTPGRVLVQHTAALGWLALTQISDLNEAMKQIERTTAPTVSRSPWWWYSGRGVPSS